GHETHQAPTLIGCKFLKIASHKAPEQLRTTRRLLRCCVSSREMRLCRLFRVSSTSFLTSPFKN
ncbi:hypothetical protein, partial [Paraburkholderia sacchari]|uniref:hypothetical protein n=1 Tax=Paraburkholderia sacchari TaxID=159450 RepID=UPI0039A66E6F